MRLVSRPGTDVCTAGCMGSQRPNLILVFHGFPKRIIARNSMVGWSEH